MPFREFARSIFTLFPFIFSRIALASPFAFPIVIHFFLIFAVAKTPAVESAFR